MIIKRGFCHFFHYRFFITRKFLVALRCGKCGVQFLRLKCVFWLLWGAVSVLALSLVVIADCSCLELSSLQSVELVTHVSLRCPVPG